MADGSGDDSGDGGRADEGRILSPNELDITESEYVEEIDDGRFVVSPETRTGKQGRQSGGGQQGGNQRSGQSAGGSQPQSGGSQRSGSANPGSRGGGQNGPQSGGEPKHSASRGRSGSGSGNRQSGGRQLSEQNVRRWLRQKYEHSNSKYAFDVTAQFDGKVSQRQLASNDLITVFESMMLWYGQQVDSNMPIEEVLGILLMESNIPIRYPPESVQNLVRSTNLGPDDTIADLLEAVQNEDGVKL